MPMKMVVIPYEKYMKLLTKSSNELSHVPNKDIENEKLETNEGIHENIKLEEETSPNIKSSLMNDKPAESSTNIGHNDGDMLDEQDILEYIPKKFKNKCKSLLFHMKKNNIKWDSSGQLILGDECLLKSHIVDLLKDLSNSYKKKTLDLNSLQLVKLLLFTHCPMSILNQNLM